MKRNFHDFIIFFVFLFVLSGFDCSNHKNTALWFSSFWHDFLSVLNFLNNFLTTEYVKQKMTGNLFLQKKIPITQDFSLCMKKRQRKYMKISLHFRLTVYIDDNAVLVDVVLVWVICSFFYIFCFYFRYVISCFILWLSMLLLLLLSLLTILKWIIYPIFV